MERQSEYSIKELNTMEDFFSIKELIKKFHLECNKKDGKIISLSSINYKEEVITSDNTKILALMYNGKPVGYELASIIVYPGVGEIDSIYIEPEHRAKLVTQDNGESIYIVKFLSNEMDKWFLEKNINIIYTSTGLNMKKNQIAYVSEGFSPVKIQKAADGHSSTVLMRKDVLKSISTEDKREFFELIKNADLSSILNTEYVDGSHLK